MERQGEHFQHDHRRKAQLLTLASPLAHCVPLFCLLHLFGRHRSAFGSVLLDTPLMRSVIADLVRHKTCMCSACGCVCVCMRLCVTVCDCMCDCGRHKGATDSIVCLHTTFLCLSDRRLRARLPPRLRSASPQPLTLRPQTTRRFVPSSFVGPFCLLRHSPWLSPTRLSHSQDTHTYIHTQTHTQTHKHTQTHTHTNTFPNSQCTLDFLAVVKGPRACDHRHFKVSHLQARTAVCV